MILSIIVPIYNASKYLHRCIDSLLAQGLKEGEYEIILINDGSKDQSLQICQEYQQTHPSICKVLSHENQGVAYTRNRGIDEAKGDYICFVDADDYLKPNGYRYLIDTYLEESIDILSFWALTLDKKTKANYVENNDIKGDICYEIKGREFLKKNIQTFIVTSFFRKSFLKKHLLSFERLTIGEDVLFSIKTYLKDPSIRMISSRIYMYDLHDESTIHQRNYTAIRKAIQSYLNLIQSIKEYIKSNHTDRELCKGLQNSMENQFVPFMSRVLSSNYSITEFKELKETLIKKDILPLKNKSKLSNIINFIFKFPSLIKCYEFIYQNIFLTYIFPHISRN